MPTMETRFQISQMQNHCQNFHSELIPMQNFLTFFRGGVVVATLQWKYYVILIFDVPFLLKAFCAFLAVSH